MAKISQIKLPNNVTYDLKDNGALQLTGGKVTGPVTFGDSVSIDDATIGNLVVNGSASFTNNIQANTINGVVVGSNPKFTDTNTITTATTTGSGNAVTAITASNGALTVTKGTTFLTAHQAVSNKNATLAWSTTSTIATIGSTDIKVTMPANPNTTPVTSVNSKTGAVTLTASDVGALASSTKYAGSSSAGGAANSLVNFKVTTTTNLGIDAPGINAIGYVSGLTKAVWNYQQTDGALYTQWYNASWIHEIFGDYRTGQISIRGRNNGSWQNWRRVLDESNYTSLISIGNLSGLTKAQVTTALGYTPPTTNTNTTYTFANGTNGFTVTPSGGTAQTVTVTPSITNNITGSGTSGYIAKFNGAHTLTNGPAIGTGTTKFLREDGTWATPTATAVWG